MHVVRVAYNQEPLRTFLFVYIIIESYFLLCWPELYFDHFLILLFCIFGLIAEMLIDLFTSTFLSV